jgi:aspartokinase
MPTGTDFEKRRGVSRVEVRDGYAQVHASRMPEPIMEGRLAVLKTVSDAQVSIDFLKLTPSGLSFLIPDSQSDSVEKALGCGEGVHCTVRPGRSVVLVHAVNMRDEEGLIARIVREIIASGARMDHISDMHDRVLVVVHTEDADPLRQWLESHLMEATAVGRA